MKNRNIRKQLDAIMLVSLSISSLLLLSSCGKRVEVPTAHVGKIKTASGLEKDLKYPSSFRLPFSLMHPIKFIRPMDSN